MPSKITSSPGRVTHPYTPRQELVRSVSFQIQEPAAVQWRKAVLASTARKSWGAWRQSEVSVGRAITLNNRLIFILGLIGMASSIWANEMVMKAIPFDDPLVDLAKTINMICSIFLIILVYLSYDMDILEGRLLAHFNRGYELHTTISPFCILQKPTFYAEIIICGSFLPPSATFELVTTTMSNIVMYRAETIFACINCLRVYTIWFVIRDIKMSTMTRRARIEDHTGVHMGSSFVCKRLMHDWTAAFWIAFLWLVCLMVLAYWYRSAEWTACVVPTSVSEKCLLPEANMWVVPGLTAYEVAKVVDIHTHYWNAWWYCFVTSTSVGYGDIYPVTHFGRFVGCSTALVGLCMMSMLTASLGVTLTWTNAEHLANLMLERENARERLRHLAGLLILEWWRRKKGKPHLGNDGKPIPKAWFAKQFHEARVMANKVQDELQGNDVKMDLMMNKVKNIESAIMNMNETLLLMAPPELRSELSSGRRLSLRRSSLKGSLRSGKSNGYIDGTMKPQGRHPSGKDDKSSIINFFPHEGSSNDTLPSKDLTRENSTESAQLPHPRTVSDKSYTKSFATRAASPDGDFGVVSVGSGSMPGMITGDDDVVRHFGGQAGDFRVSSGEFQNELIHTPASDLLQSVDH